MWLCSGKMWKSNAMNIFIYHFPRPGGVKSYHAVLKFRDEAPLFTISFWTLKNPSHASQKRHRATEVLSCGGSSWAIKHFDFQKLAGLWLARLITNHVWIYGSNVVEGFSAFQHRSCFNYGSIISCQTLRLHRVVDNVAQLWWHMSNLFIRYNKYLFNIRTVLTAKVMNEVLAITTYELRGTVTFLSLETVYSSLSCTCGWVIIYPCLYLGYARFVKCIIMGYWYPGRHADLDEDEVCLYM